VTPNRPILFDEFSLSLKKGQLKANLSTGSFILLV